MRLDSKIDQSTNWVEDRDIGKSETRVVYRAGYAIIYLSAQTGCNKGCSFCHLTQSGQTRYRNQTAGELIADLRRAEETIPPNLPVHINFMARGEPLANPNVNADLISSLHRAVGRKSTDRISARVGFLNENQLFSILNTALRHAPGAISDYIATFIQLSSKNYINPKCRATSRDNKTNPSPLSKRISAY